MLKNTCTFPVIWCCTCQQVNGTGLQNRWTGEQFWRFIGISAFISSVIPTALPGYFITGDSGKELHFTSSQDKMQTVFQKAGNYHGKDSGN